jgi:hypothetical protein
MNKITKITKTLLILLICFNLSLLSLSKQNFESLFIDSGIESEIETESNFSKKNNRLDFNNLIDNLLNYSQFILQHKFDFTTLTFYNHITEVLTSPPNFVKI